MSRASFLPGFFASAMLLTTLSFAPGARAQASQDWDHDHGTVATLTFKQGSSHKIEQVNGDCDWVVWDATDVVAKDGTVSNNNSTCKPTVSKTTTRFDVLGDDIGTSFEHEGKLVFPFGDTTGATSGKGSRSFLPKLDISFSDDYMFNAGDPIAYSSTQRPEQGLLLDYFPSLTSSTLPLLVQPVYPPSSIIPQCVPGSSVPMGGDDTPNAGISLNGQIIQ